MRRRPFQSVHHSLTAYCLVTINVFLSVWILVTMLPAKLACQFSLDYKSISHNLPLKCCTDICYEQKMNPTDFGDAINQSLRLLC